MLFEGWNLELLCGMAVSSMDCICDKEPMGSDLETDMSAIAASPAKFCGHLKNLLSSRYRLVNPIANSRATLIQSPISIHLGPSNSRRDL